ncbi:branched-chain amino acid aminotransferase [Luminiphilus syltensis NOR5-1B]|uniref:Branched-chain-amino-acid aminotransferase n=1 Tax=Luminiphilus syltensis NOR5-1B TaxID=565045 RepID=B8KXY8_9GAMM|nr:branched-chain amino acid aminotransferase [Luminiphilus syltensis]EED36510.1 branched-chain amino acid aminotransferase [Luminiphilus syltensis NOR5-1B]
MNQAQSIPIHRSNDNSIGHRGKAGAFGTTFGDHMFSQDFDGDQGWSEAGIHPLNGIRLHPAASVLHYGQEIFEGLKAYRRADGEVCLFRAIENCRRFNRSAARMAMPEVDENFHLQALCELVALDKDWVPSEPGSSLYLRPAMIATSPRLGLAASTQYKHFIISSPVAAYFGDGHSPLSVLVSDHHRRAVKGGVGEAKTGGNYAASLQVSEAASRNGFDQVLWLDAIEGKYIEEVGAMNICFVYDNEKIVTPALSGSILEGITRDSILKLAPHLGLYIEESRLAITEVLDDIDSGRITEVFGCGTAAVVSPVGTLTYKGEAHTVNNNMPGRVTRLIHREITNIQYGEVDDPYGWITLVK